MARPRKQAATQNGAGEFTCPECGKTFSRPAALGAHRRRAHGVPGASSSSSQAKRKGQAAKSTGRRRPTAATGTAPKQDFDRDALLQQLFPNGIPARESVIRRIESWLDEAETLAKMK